MEYRRLGRTDLEVSLICLGTMTWGEQNTQEHAFEQLDYAINAGVNFIDTAELYPVPPMAATYGRTEEIIGHWLKARNCRDKVILASKVAGPGDWVEYMRGPDHDLNASNIERAIEDSLKRLQTDYLDLYQVHWPSRSTNFFGKLGYAANHDYGVAIEETLAVLNQLVKSGKVRHIGISNETPWGCSEYLRLSRDKHFPRAVSIQNPYSLLNRSFEIGLAEFAQREHVGLLAYSPLAFGTLSGKYLNNARPQNTRLTLFERFSRYINPHAVAATEKYVRLAQQHQLDPAQMALAYINSRPFITSNIIGATTMDQLRSNIASVNLTLNEEVFSAIEAIHVEHPNPAP